MSDKTDHSPFPPAFEALGVRPSILRALAQEKFVTPSEIQAMLIPPALQGLDILGQARTGTGKTAAFGIPLLQKCSRTGATQALILVPTRELAIQVDAEIQRLGQFTPVRSVPVYGGQKITAQMRLLKNHPPIIVGTPGRVIDLLDRRILNFNNIRFVVLDEVDRMLDIGFRDDIRNILSRVKQLRRRVQVEGTAADFGEDEDSGGPDEAPARIEEATPQPAGMDQHDLEPRTPGSDHSIQLIFVSATIAGEIERLGRAYMREPVLKLVAPGAEEKPTVAEVDQFYLSVEPWDKYRLLRALLQQEQPELAIVFCRTKHGAQKLAKKLYADGIECREIHGNLNQSKRDKVMKQFRGGKFEVLVATDLASRGIDVAGISHIINFDIPDDPEAYVHRIGRTARMGAKGRAFTFVTRDQGGELTKIEHLINMLVPEGQVEGFERRPTPSDWEASAPGPRDTRHPQRQQAPAGPSGASGTAQAAPAAPVRKLTIGSKIPRSRHKRRR